MTKLNLICQPWTESVNLCISEFLLSHVLIGVHSWQCAVTDTRIYAQAARDGNVCHTQVTIWQIYGFFWIFKISLITKPGMSWAQVFSIQVPSAERIWDKEFCWDIRIQVGYLNRGHRDHASSASGFIQPPRWAAGTARWTFPLCWPTPVLPCQDCCVWCLAIGLSYIYGHLPVQTPNALSGACEIWWNYLLSFNWIPSRWLANLW